MTVRTSPLGNDQFGKKWEYPPAPSSEYYKLAIVWVDRPKSTSITAITFLGVEEKLRQIMDYLLQVPNLSLRGGNSLPIEKESPQKLWKDKFSSLAAQFTGFRSARKGAVLL